jgi:hypothetical protein
MRRAKLGLSPQCTHPALPLFRKIVKASTSCGPGVSVANAADLSLAVTVAPLQIDRAAPI